MSSLNDKRIKRTRTAKRPAPAMTTTRVSEAGKRKSNPELSDSENKNKKRYSLPANGGKEMTLESGETMDSPLCDFNDNVHRTRSCGNSPNLVAVVPEKRRSLRQQAIQNDNTKKNIEDNTISPLAIKRAHTPTELISEMTSFTFSNYFTPVSKENSPLPLLAWADNDEVWEVMLQRDRDYKRDPLYIRKHPKLRPRMRSVLLDWLIEVSEVYKLHRETFYLAVDFVDRYLSTEKNIAKTRLQLVGVTSLFVASKIEEIYPPKLSEFAYVTDGACTNDEILNQEILLLQSLNWKLSPVTPVSWLTVYLQIANKNLSKSKKHKVDESFDFPQFSGIHLCRVSELMDLCCLDIGFLQFSSSIIAASSLYHMWGKDLLEITGHNMAEIYPCIQWLQPFAQVVLLHDIKKIKRFDKIPTEDAHNIQVHNNGIQLLDLVHSHVNTKVPVNNMRRTSPMVQCSGILTPPASTEKDYLL